MWTKEGKGEGGANWERSSDVKTRPGVKQIAPGNLQCTQRAQLSALQSWRGGPPGVGSGCGGKEVQEGGGIRRHVADALCVQQKLT